MFLSFSFIPGGQRLPWDSPDLLHLRNTVQRCSSLNWMIVRLRLEVNAFLLPWAPPGASVAPVWGLCYFQCRRDPPTIKLNGVVIAAVQSFEKFPFCSTLLFNCFGLNAGCSLFDGDDVDDVMLLIIQPSVQIFHLTPPDHINLLWVTTRRLSSVLHETDS